jgi:asparagine synthase (glutamine-hydrolysing)
MCGIFGIISPNLSRDQLEKATSTLTHRGPDDSGLFFGDGVGLGHRRLSIIDLNQLIQKGHIFSTKSDTETILHAYEEWGEKCVEHFNGMFGFAIWDAKNRTMFMARDRLGIKPLFYAEYKGKFSFASEMKAILADHEFNRDLDEMALAKYWDLYFRPDRTRDEKYFIQGFMDLLQESVKMRLISEVPLGAFISGGIDSSTVVALMSKTSNKPVNTFSIGFGGNTGAYLDYS